jgi:hypothetical protein
MHEREDGSLLVSGWMAADEFTERLGCRATSRGTTRRWRGWC